MMSIPADNPGRYASEGPVAFLKERAVEHLANAKRFHSEAGISLDQAMTAALEEIPSLWIPETLTEECLAEVVLSSSRLLACAEDGLDAIRLAHTEADMAFRSEMALDREERGGKL
jgi:hypothetical protein